MSAASITADQLAVKPGAAEEMAGPPHIDPSQATRPVAAAERVSAVDTLRGVALLGILAMNITSFGLPAWAYDIPLSTPLPVFNGPHATANTTAWFLRWILAEGKMRALFSMLFGAGAVLLTSRAEARGAGDRTADIFTRRNMWLMLFGMLHCYLIWYGDILYLYGVIALIFLYPMRKLPANTLFRVAAVVLVLNSVGHYGGQLAGTYAAREKAVAADKLYREGKPVTEEESKDIRSWHEAQEDWRPPQKKINEDVKAMTSGWAKAQAHNAKDAFQGELYGAYLGFGDMLGFMLLGMGLYRNGFLTGKLRTKTYVWTAIVGLGVSWPLIFAGCWHAWKSGFDLFVSMWWLMVPYDIGRVTGALGNAAVVLLILRSGALQFLTRRLAAVGQMALSNYLLTSISCKLLFCWTPLHWYGRVEYYRLYGVMAAVWAVNLTWSLVWLQYFQFGPAEWLWRSLTYWKKQPMRLRSQGEPASSAAQVA